MLSIFVDGRSFFDNRNPDPRGQFPDSRRKIGVLIFHHESEDASAHATAETVKRLALGADMKRRRFFLVKWTERLEICAGPFQWKIGADDFHDVIRGCDLLNGFRRDHVALFFARLLSEAMPNLLSVEALSKL